ncbi:MAG: endonuclease III [Thermoprotei archaeon]|nr:MAG: endonuclease III [Thermoprotei archaeon]RLE73384.1 MAG: endonuclease III [Thermoprotei archaeon]
MLNKNYADIILSRLEKKFMIPKGEFIAYDIYKSTGDPFKVLVATIISQNTLERNSYKAYSNLEKIVGIDPDKIYKTSLKMIEDAIKPAGLWKNKAKAIKVLAETIVEKYSGDIKNLFKGTNVNEVREKLKSIKGIGFKTIDVVLANLGYGVIPLDTHVKRVAYRLGLTKAKTYTKIQEDLHRIIEKRNRLKAHLLLIMLGRKYCRSKKPLCEKCVLEDICLKVGVNR